MRRNLLFLFCLFAGMLAMAGPVTRDEAQQKVADFLMARGTNAFARGGMKLQLAAVSHYESQPKTMTPSYYVFNVGSGNGFVVAGADDRVPAILGYSMEGRFDPRYAPKHLKAWLQSYSDQMAWLNQHPEDRARKVVSGGSISPLLGKTEWNQDSPYNNKCPLDGGNNCVTGCVATAMAQVMYYHKWPNQTSAEIPGYTTGSKGLVLPAIAAGTSIDWANMVPKYTGGETQAQQDAVAQLMLMCGTAVQMDYTAGSSGAYGGNVAVAWREYFDYDAATIYEDRNEYRQAEWNQKVYDELLARRPVFYDGQSSGGGHAFVIDGYDSDDYFHVNWGWGGYCNSYFLLSILDPGSNSGIGASSSSDGYSFDQGAIFGAQKNTGVPVEVIPIMTTQDATLPEGGEFTRESAENDFDAYVGFSYINGLQNTYNFEFSVGLFDDFDNMLSVVGGTGSVELDPGWGYYTPLSMEVMFGADMPDGTYFLKPISRQSETETWYPNKRTSLYFITATISGNTLTLSPPVVNLSGTLDVTGKIEMGSHVSLTASITNNGTLFNDQLFLVVDGEMVGGRHFDIDAGDTQAVGFSFIPTTAGNKSVSVCLRSWNSGTYQYDYTPIASTSVTVNAPSAANLSMIPTTKNANAEGVVEENFLLVSIEVTNNGSEAYDNDVCFRLYKFYDENHGSPAGDASKTIQLAAGATTTVELQLDGLEDGARYFYYVYYKSEGGWTQGYPYSPIFTVNLHQDPDPEPDPVVDFKVTSLDLSGTMVTGDPVNVSVSVKNDGNVETGLLYVFAEGQLIKTLDLSIAAGESKTYEAQFTPTTAGEKVVSVTSDAAGAEVVVTKTATITDPEPQEETGYFLVSDLNNWSTTDQSLAFTKLDDGLTWEITFPGTNPLTGSDNFYLKVAPASVYNNQDNFWNLLLCAPADGWTALSGDMVVNGGAWLMTSANTAQSYTMRIVPSAMTYEIIVTEKEKPFVPEPPFYLVGTPTDWQFDSSYEFEGLGDGEHFIISVPADYDSDGNFWFKIAPAGAIAADGTIDWNRMLCAPDDGASQTDGTMVLGDATAWCLPGSDWVESYVITINASTLQYSIEPVYAVVEKFTVSQLELTGLLKAGEPVQISMLVTNEGNVSTGRLYVRADGELVDVLSISLEPGRSQTYESYYIPQDSGESEVTVSTDEAGHDVLARKSVAIAEADRVQFVVDNLTVEGTMYVADVHLVTLTVSNQGNVSEGQLYLFLNGSQLDVLNLTIAPGESRDYWVYFTPQAAGDYVVTVTTDAEGTDVLATATVTVVEPVGIDELLRSIGSAPVQVYTTGGRLLASTTSAELKRVVRQLPKGVYIVRSGRQSKTVRN